jgi:Ni/Co efflux regulator RcnB
MKRLLLAASLALLSLSPTMALAHHDDDNDRHEYRGHHDGQGDHDDDDRRYHHPGRHKGWKKHRDYHRGERIEVVYLQPRYYVDDYPHYHLRHPPRGHRWVRTEDGRFILVAVATGIIADILLHH